MKRLAEPPRHAPDGARAGGKRGAKMSRSVAAIPSACIGVMHACVALAAEVRRSVPALCETHLTVRFRSRDAFPVQ